ncbi:MAG: hypothetical protein QOI39_1287 [Mycobacterium sp.]|jgi:hypothetical protein|nr:hypothetical protein [Mycobacterium sp.]
MEMGGRCSLPERARIFVVDKSGASVSADRPGSRRFATMAQIESKHDVRRIAAEINVAPTVLVDLMAGGLDTVLGGCIDFLGGPHAAHGQPCAASFLMCLSCPCARATPAHLPVIVAVHDRLQDKANQMTPLRWAQRFAGPVAQLTDVLNRYPTTAVEDARAQISPEQRDLVERFLRRSLDVR